jgi:hypothetical protein
MAARARGSRGGIAMRTTLRIAALVLGIIGAFDALVVNVAVSILGRFRELVGWTPDTTHGFIGILVVILALVGAVLVVRYPVLGGALMIIAGLAFFYVAHWWGLLASPQLLIAGLLGVAERSEPVHTGLQRTAERMAS